MTLGLSSQIVANGIQTTRADGVDRISLCPPQALVRRRVSLLSRDRGATTFQTLQQPTQDSRWMDSDEHVHMSPDHSDLQDSRTFLRCDGAQEATQEPRHPCIDQRLAIAGLPDDVTINTIDHATNLNRVGRTVSSFLRNVRLYLRWIRARGVASELAARPTRTEARA